MPNVDAALGVERRAEITMLAGRLGATTSNAAGVDLLLGIRSGHITFSEHPGGRCSLPIWSAR